MEPVDEYTLASFIAGTLSPQRRSEVVRYLDEHEDARELLKMAYLALDSARTEAPEPQMAPPAPAVPSPRVDRAPVRQPQRLPSLARFAALAVLVLSVGAGIRLFVGPPPDQFRSHSGIEGTALAPRVSTSDLTFRWNAIPEADRYEIVVWDEVNAEVVAEHSVRAPRTERDDPFTQTLKATLRPDHPYSLRVDAIDAENRLVVSSEMVPLRR